MKKLGQLLKDLGFNQHASVAAQEAFLRHMQRAAQLEVTKATLTSADKPSAEQLTFDPQVLGESKKAK